MNSRKLLYMGMVARIADITAVLPSRTYRNSSRTTSNITPPMTTNTIAPRAQIFMGLRFASCSALDGCVGFFPAFAELANFALRCRISNSVGILRLKERLGRKS